MNQLSWLIYIADAGHSAEGWFAFFGVIAGIVTVICTIVAAIMNCVCASEKDDYGRRLSEDQIAFRKETAKQGNKVLGQLLWGFAPLAFLCIVMTAAIPSRETVYAIAASELGEAVATSEIGQKAGQALEAWLDKQITETRAAAAEAVSPEASKTTEH